MPIIENYDGTFDVRDARDGEIVRFRDGRCAVLSVKQLDPNEEKWLKGRVDENNYTRVSAKTTCVRCGKEFTFHRNAKMSRAAFPKTCEAHRGMTAKQYESLKTNGLLAKTEEQNLKGHFPVLYPDKLERGGIVVYRNLAFVILSVRDHVSVRTGKLHKLLDIAGRCVVCGEEFPIVAGTAGNPLPLRCDRCQKLTGSGWRYSPLKDTGAPVYMGVDPAHGGDRSAIVMMQAGRMIHMRYDEAEARFVVNNPSVVEAIVNPPAFGSAEEFERYKKDAMKALIEKYNTSYHAKESS